MKSKSVHAKFHTLWMLLLALPFVAFGQQPASLEFVDYSPKSVCQGGVLSLTFVARNGSGQGQDLKYQDSIHQPGARASLYQLSATSGAGTFTLTDWFWTTGITYPISSNQASPPITIQVPITPTIGAGTYTLSFASQYPDGVSTNDVQLAVTQASTASIQYAGSPFCQGGGTVNVSRTGDYGGSGTYTASLGGLSINTSTGAIDLNASTPGTYTVTFAYTEAPCPTRYAFTSVTILSPSAGGTATAADPIICAGSSTSISLGGNTGTIQKWQSSTNGTTWNDIVSTVNPLNTGSLNATTYFRAVVKNGACAEANSSVATVTVNQPPVITSQPSSSNATYCQDAVATALSVTATGAGLTYQWYSNASATNSGGTSIPSATGNTYTPSTTTAGTLYYYVVVSGTCGTATSTVSGAILVNPTTTITAQSTGAATYCQDATATALSVTANGASLQYQWYSNTSAVNTGGTLISGANSNTYTPSTATAGNMYYYVAVTGTCGTGTSTVSGAIVVRPTTAITAFSAPATTYCQSETAAVFSVSATGSNLAYQWYSNASASNSGGTLLTGATGSTYTPSTAAAGTLYYYVVVSGDCGTVTSTVSGAILVNPTTVINTENLGSAGYCQNAPATALSVSATGTNLQYQWYWNATASNSGGTLIPGANGNTYTPSTATAGTTYYYVVVTGTCGTATSSVSGAIMVTLQTVITGQPSAANSNYCQDDMATAFSVTVAGSGLNYQWYSNTVAANTGGTMIGGANGNTYIPSTATAGTTYYYVVVNGDCGTATSTVSGAIMVKPTTVINSQTTPGATYCQDAPATAFSVNATGANLQYQWYSNAAASNIGGALITGATASTYTPSTATVGTTYYYVVVSGDCGSATSAVSGAIVVNAPTVIISSSLSGATYCQSDAVAALSVTATGTNLQYQWYWNTVAANTGGTVIGGANSYTYTPSTAVAGTRYYYAVVTGTCGSETTPVSGAIVVNATPPAPEGFETSTLYLCEGSAVADLQVRGGENILWYGTATGTTALPSGTLLVNGTTYYASQTTTEGCESVLRLAVTVQLVACNATFHIDRVDPSCYGVADGKIVITNIAGGTPPYMISMNNGYSFVDVTNPALFEFTGVPAGVYNILLKHDDGKIQPLSTTSLLDPPLITADINTSNEISCSNSTSVITVSNVEGGHGAPFLFSLNGGAYSSTTSWTVGAGTYTISAQDKTGCSMVIGTVTLAGVATVTIHGPVVTNVSTFGGSNGSISLSVTGGSGNYMVTLHKPGGSSTVVNAGNNTVTFSNLTAGTYTISVADNDGCGTVMTTATVNQPDQAPLPPDLVLGSESDMNTFATTNTHITLVYNVANVSPNGTAYEVKLRITKPTRDYHIVMPAASTYTNTTGTVYTLDNSRWSITEDNDLYVEFTLDKDPGDQNMIPPAMYTPKRLMFTVTRMNAATGKGEFPVTGMIYCSVADGNDLDNTTIHRYNAQ
ncbi:MAG: beta strand repeat-containing protein [Flavisolibacter sp.]